jgi:Sec-independent protein secretion pathway component TatC
MMKDMRIALLWVIVLFNIAFADIVGFMVPGTLEMILTGETGFEITQNLLLIFAVLLEIPILMVILNIWVSPEKMKIPNLVAVAVTTIFVIGGGSATLPYFFFAGCEIIAMAVIVRLSISQR